MFGAVKIAFTSPAQAHAVYDVVEHRVLAVPMDIDKVPFLEQDEVMELVTFLHRMQALIRRDAEE